MDTPEIAAIRTLEGQVRVMAYELRKMGYEGELPVNFPLVSELSEFLEGVADSQSKFAKDAKALLAKL